MRIISGFIGFHICLLFCFEHAYAQKKASRLVGECRYHVYTDIKGVAYIVPIDSVHYGYNGNRGGDLNYAYNNTLDTDKYPEMAYLPDPGFYEIYPAQYDTAIKMDNIQDTSSFQPKWNIYYLEINEYNQDNCRDKKTDVLGRGFSVYKYDNENRLTYDYVCIYNKARDSALQAGYIQYAYDGNGRMASREFIPANAADSSIPIIYNYDQQGRISEVRSPNRTVSFTYDSIKKTKVINMKILEPKNVADSEISVRCSYIYDKGNVVFYKEDKYEKSIAGWETMTKDTISYDDKHHVTSFRDGRTGLYHDYKMKYSALGQPVMRTADETGRDDTRTLPDGSEGKLTKIECKYYYETYIPASTAR